MKMRGAIVIICVAVIFVTVTSIRPNESYPASIDKVVTRGETQTPPLSEDFIRGILIQQQREDNISHKWLEWWPIILCVASILIMYGSQKQRNVDIDLALKKIDAHMENEDAHWTARERQALQEMLTKIYERVNRP
jgi:hypothetical protein